MTSPPAHRLDSQLIEILGRQTLIADLLFAGIEVAIPIRDRGIDLIAYLDRDPDVGFFVGVPIQLKASTQSGFGVERKYERTKNLVLAFVWYLQSPTDRRVFALRYRDAVGVAESMGWTTTASWQKGGYANMKPGRRLRELLAPFEMTPEKWRPMLASVVAEIHQECGHSK